MQHLGFGHHPLGSLVIFVLPAYRTIDAQHAGTHPPGIREDIIQADLAAAYPSAVEPQDIELAISAAGYFTQLVAGIIDIGTPPVGMHLLLIVGAAVRRGIVRIPEPLMMPVRFGEVCSHHEIPIPEGLEYIACKVLAGIACERPLRRREIAVPGIEQAEPVVMFGGENGILHAGIFADAGPLLRVEINRIELVSKAPVPLFVILVPAAFRAYHPVFVAQVPRLHYPGDGVQAPVDEHPELEVLPGIQFLEHQRIRRPLIAVILRSGRKDGECQGRERGDEPPSHCSSPLCPRDARSCRPSANGCRNRPSSRRNTR